MILKERKTIICLFSFGLFLTILLLKLIPQQIVATSFAQEFTYRKAYQDYLYNYDLYQKSYSEYLVANNEAQAYQTLTSQNRLLDARRKTLTSQSFYLQTFLTALRMKLNEETNIINYQQNYLYIKLDDEIAYLKQYQQNLSSPSTLEDLNLEANKLIPHLTAMNNLAFKTRSVLFETRINNNIDEIESEITFLEGRIAQMREENIKVDTLERWLILAKDKLNLSKQKLNNALTVYKADSNVNIDQAKFNQSQKLYEESKQYLKETVTLLKEIIREINHV